MVDLRRGIRPKSSRRAATTISAPAVAQQPWCRTTHDTSSRSDHHGTCDFTQLASP